MELRRLAVPDSYELTPVQYPDERGRFLEWFRGDVLARETGHAFTPVQANLSVSRRGVVRGIHFADVPPGQAKYVTAVSGAVLDFIVDLRVGSPTFGEWDSVRLDDVDRRAVFLAEGLGHAFVALSESATVSYLVSTPFAPGREHGVDPFDARIGLEFGLPVDELLRSPKDAEAPGLDAALAAGILPDHATCLEWYRRAPTEG